MADRSEKGKSQARSQLAKERKSGGLAATDEVKEDSLRTQQLHGGKQTRAAGSKWPRVRSLAKGPGTAGDRTLIGCALAL